LEGIGDSQDECWGTKSVEFAAVAVCSTFFHKMTGILPSKQGDLYNIWDSRGLMDRERLGSESHGFDAQYR